MKTLVILLLAAAGLSGCGTALHGAAKRNDVAEIQRLLSSGAKIDAYNQGADKWTPLHYAALRGNNAAVKALLDAGADPLHASSGGNARTIASNFRHPDTAALILPYERRARAKWSDTAVPSESTWSGVGSGVSQALDQEALPRSHGNLDDAAYARMRASAAMPPEKKDPVSDVDEPKARGGERPDDFAFVVGVEEYQSLPKADYGARDAQIARKHFEALGVPARNIISLEGSQATGSKLKNYLQQWLPRNVKPASTVFVYYSGHGAPDPESGEAYLVPWDADPMFLTTSGYPLKQFYAELAKLKAKRVLVVLDACFSGSGGRSVLAKGARPLVAKVDESVPAAANITVLAAASGTEITGSLDEQGHGIFTYHFLKGLSGGAKTPRALFDYLKPHVQDDARRQNREQSPTLAGSGTDAPF